MSSLSEQIEWRRAKTLELLSRGLSQREIGTVLQVSAATVNNDVKHLRAEAEARQGEYIQQLPLEHLKAIAGLDSVLRELWILFAKSEDPKLRQGTLAIISEVVMKRQALLGDAGQIEKALALAARVRNTLHTGADDATNLEQETEEVAIP